MASTPKGVMNELTRAIGRDFSATSREFHANLISATPSNTGRARAGWQHTYREQLFKSPTFQIERNNVPYIGVLDTGTSSQAPRGIVMPAVNKTRNLK